MKLVLVRGLPGSGKSTHAKTMNMLHVEADMLCMANGAYAFDATKHRQNHATCQTIAWLCLSSGADCVVSNTFTQLWEMEPYLKIAKSVGAQVEIIRMTGEYGSIHNVPTETLDKMRSRFENFDGEVLM